MCSHFGVDLLFAPYGSSLLQASSNLVPPLRSNSQGVLEAPATAVWVQGALFKRQPHAVLPGPEQSGACWHSPLAVGRACPQQLRISTSMPCFPEALPLDNKNQWSCLAFPKWAPHLPLA